MKKLLFILFIFVSCFTSNAVCQEISLETKLGGFTDFDYNKGLTFATETEFKFNKNIGTSMTIQCLTTFEGDIDLSMPLMVNYHPIDRMSLKCGYDVIGRIPFAVSFEHKNFVFETRYFLKTHHFNKSFLSFTIGYKIDI